MAEPAALTWTTRLPPLPTADGGIGTAMVASAFPAWPRSPKDGCRSKAAFRMIGMDPVAGLSNLTETVVPFPVTVRDSGKPSSALNTT